ncbi:hypothetical protein P280DRAFT_514003 [Massarina eburnea CBS 473.64]|uniref:Uncharacterized protein n=1 Tax=Massarina eburnea CBS 473.64 TaxID=1395130 RepID=A0A6A6S9U8_9PLEO|nr:hypothetical protein P280DRAFT_514003 [Massarina eburnea CBS 473.64]
MDSSKNSVRYKSKSHLPVQQSSTSSHPMPMSGKTDRTELRPQLSPWNLYLSQNGQDYNAAQMEAPPKPAHYTNPYHTTPQLNDFQCSRNLYDKSSSRFRMGHNDEMPKHDATPIDTSHPLDSNSHCIACTTPQSQAFELSHLMSTAFHLQPSLHEHSQVHGREGAHQSPESYQGTSLWKPVWEEIPGPLEPMQLGPIMTSQTEHFEPLVTSLTNVPSMKTLQNKFRINKPEASTRKTRSHPKKKGTNPDRTSKRPPIAGTKLRFSSRDEAAKAMSNESWDSPYNDPTLPTSEHEHRIHVERLFVALSNIHDVNDRHNASFETRWRQTNTDDSPRYSYYGEEAMEKVCWDLVDKAILLHKEGPHFLGIYDSRFWAGITQKTRKLTFSQRIDYISEVLKKQKSRCDEVMKGNYALVLLDPVEALKSSEQNKENNHDRSVKYKIGKEAQQKKKAAEAAKNPEPIQIHPLANTTGKTLSTANIIQPRMPNDEQEDEPLAPKGTFLSSNADPPPSQHNDDSRLDEFGHWSTNGEHPQILEARDQLNNTTTESFISPSNRRYHNHGDSFLEFDNGILTETLASPSKIVAGRKRQREVEDKDSEQLPQSRHPRLE